MTLEEYELYKLTKPSFKLNVNFSTEAKHRDPVETLVLGRKHLKEIKLIAVFNVTDISSATKIMNSDAISQFNRIEIDGVVQPSVVATYQFDTIGEHTVKYILKDETSIGNSAFKGCNNLVSVTIPDSVTNIGINTFNGCDSLTSITIPDSVTNIGINTFNGCDSLTSITIPNGVTSIGNNAFSGCIGLVTITVDNNNSIYDSRDNCNAIIETATNTLIAGCKNTVIPNSVTSIGNAAFAGCTSLTTITIPDSVTSIGNSAFQNCSGLTSITIGSGVTSIDNGAFCRCSGLTSITIPDSITYIGTDAFNSCSSLISVTIGSGVTSIGNWAFGSCSSLTSIVSNAMKAPTIQGQTFKNVKTGGTLYVPQGSSGYNAWMSSREYELGKYNWTKVEQ